MTYLRSSLLAAAALAALCSSCAQPAHTPAISQAAGSAEAKPRDNPTAPIFNSNDPQPHASPDPRRTVPFLVRLNVYQITVPSRTVSRSEEFWKHVDEGPAVLDPATHDLLYKNGLRVGVAPAEDWAYFRAILSRQRAVTQVSSSSGDRPTVLEVPLKQQQPAQDLFWFDGDDEDSLSGQEYADCDDFFSFRFHPTPRRDGDVTLTILPLLRSTRERIEYTVREAEVLPHFRELYPEYLFDLRLRTIIPYDRFMVIGASPLAHLPLTVGHNFLMQSGKGEEFETLLLISPQAFRLDDPSTQPTTRE